VVGCAKGALRVIIPEVGVPANQGASSSQWACTLAGFVLP